MSNIKIYNEDCLNFLKRCPEDFYELAICDVPYGIGADKAQNAGGEKWGYKKYKDTDWDSEIPSAEYFKELFRVSKNQIMWGGNYLTEHLPASMGWIFWDKGQRDFSLADGELAWTSFNRALRVFTMPRGAALADANKNGGGRIHPTQKPVKLYEWILDNYAKENDRILDTHLGSGSIAIACHNRKYKLTACELDTDYYNMAIKRLKQHQQQLTMF